MLGPYLDQLHVACRRVTVDDATSQVVVIETSPMKRLSR